MMSIVGPSASNPDIKRGILHTRIFWQLNFFQKLYSDPSMSHPSYGPKT
jgi:hypothetical protein